MPVAEFVSTDGSKIKIEVEEAPGLQQASALTSVVPLAWEAVESSLESIKQAAVSIVNRMSAAMPKPPQKIELQFGLKLLF